MTRNHHDAEHGSATSYYNLKALSGFNLQTWVLKKIVGVSLCIEHFVVLLEVRNIHMRGLWCWKLKLEA